MSLKFNLDTFGQNLQKVGQGLMQGGLLIGTTSMIHQGGFYGSSIWGCGGGFMTGGCMPPLNIWHPMYGPPSNPYLTQQGLNIAYQQGAARMAQIMQEMNNPQIPEVQESTQPSPQNVTPEIGKQLDQALQNQGEYSLVSNEWTKLNEKAEKTPEEEETLKTVYDNSIQTTASSYLKFIDQKLGTDDNKLTKDEFTNYIIYSTIGENATAEQKAKIKTFADNAFANLNLNNDDKISAEEIADLLKYIDASTDGKLDGKITSEGFGLAIEKIIKPAQAQGNSLFEKFPLMGGNE